MCSDFVRHVLSANVMRGVSGGPKQAGIGFGKLQGDIANLEAIFKMAMPYLYLRVFEWGVKRNIKSAPFYLYAFWFMLNNALFLTVKNPQK